MGSHGLAKPAAFDLTYGCGCSGISTMSEHQRLGAAQKGHRLAASIEEVRSPD